MKEVIKSKTKKILIIVLIILLPIFIYLLIDGKNLYVDMYNFRQLEKAKPYLETIDKNTKKFYNLKEFNEIYNADIQPIKNCYSVNMNNGKYIYKFGFKLESYIYIYIYGNEYYIYPGDDIPFSKFCDGGPRCIADINRKGFEEVISNPCKD